MACTKKPLSVETQLTVGTSPNYPPYEMIGSNGEPEGFDIDIAKAIGKKLNRKVVFKDMGFDALILGLKLNKFDMIMSGMSITPAREKEIVMVPYQGDYTKSLALIFLEKIPANVKSLTDLKGQIVAVQSGTYQDVYLRKFPAITNKALESTPELVMDLKNKKSVAILLEPHIASDVMRKYAGFQRLEIVLPEDEWVKGNGIGIKKGNDRLSADIQWAVNDLRREGVIDQLEKKWLSSSK